MFKFICLLALAAAPALGQDLPKEWIDPDTGHRVVRLTDEPGSQSLYFHQNPYTATGDGVYESDRLVRLRFQDREVEVTG